MNKRKSWLFPLFNPNANISTLLLSVHTIMQIKSLRIKKTVLQPTQAFPPSEPEEEIRNATRKEARRPVKFGYDLMARYFLSL